ncbi:MAG: TetR/AcrR family transcriptional regulator [Propionibacteriaceae bacterium]|nr:TetR/AcrR family transcriptional regulator [Propionibacteriaceae bacterium]
MAKSFGDRERELIQGELIEACKQCWSRYGYQKTGIRELAQMANISTGAFYRFFDSKEMLFVATANEYQRELIDIFHTTMAQCPGKQGVATSIKRIVAAMSSMAWLTSMWEEWPVIIRKLPPDFIEEDFRGDVIRIADIIQQYGLTAKRDTESTTQIVDLLLTAVTRQNYLPGDTGESIDFIIDSVIDALFE